MKLRKAEKYIIIITLVFLALVGGFKIGQSTGTDFKIQTVKQAEESQEPAVSAQPKGKVNINTATAEELDTLFGIGEKLAQRIIDYREEHGPFGAVEDITRVSGIGSDTYDGIKNDITVK